jgi:hypothetical protein
VREKENDMALSDAEKVKVIKAASREIHKGMPKGGFHSPRKGKKVYTRKAKHSGRAWG